MRVTSGKVVSGQVIVEGEPLPEGSLVTILLREADESFHLDESAEAELLESIAEAERGELIPAARLMGVVAQKLTDSFFECVRARIEQH